MPGLAPDRRAFRKAERKRLVTLPLPWFVQSRCPALADMIGGHRVRTALMISSDGSLGGGSRWCRGWHGRAGAETMFSGTLSRASSSACAWRSLCGATLRLTPASAARRQNSPRAAAPETVARAWAVDDGDSGPTGGSAGPSATAVAAPSATRRCRPRAGAGRCTFNATTASTLRRRAIPRPASSRAARSGDSTEAGDDAMTRSEEEVPIGKRRRERGRARLKKYVVTHYVEKKAPVRREEVRLKIRADRAPRAADKHALTVLIADLRRARARGETVPCRAGGPARSGVPARSRRSSRRRAGSPRW